MGVHICIPPIQLISHCDDVFFRQVLKAEKVFLAANEHNEHQKKRRDDKFQDLTNSISANILRS